MEEQRQTTPTAASPAAAAPAAAPAPAATPPPAAAPATPAAESERSELFICRFNDTARAHGARKIIQALEHHFKLIDLGNIGVVKKSAEGRVSLQETQDIHGSQGAVLGALIGATMGTAGLPLLGLMGLLGAAVFGALAGGMSAYALDMGFPNRALKHLGATLEPGQSVLVTLLRPGDVELVSSELERLDGTLLHPTVAPDLAERLLHVRGR